MRYIIGMIAVLLIAYPASAHNATSHQGKDWSSTYDDHTYIKVKDVECDSHMVYVEWHTKGVVGSNKMSDYDGCANDGKQLFVGHDHEVGSFRTCEINDEEGFIYCGQWAHKS